jgi:peptidyl-prolyl cis-trans isomerase D
MEEAYRFGLLQNILDEMVSREVLRQETVRDGLIIGRDEIAANVHALVKEQIQPGETAQQTLDRLLATRGMREADLVASVRENASTQLIAAPLKASVSFVPKLATQALARFHGERRDISFFTLTPEMAGANIKADEATLKTYYEGIKDQFQIPEQRSFKVLALKTDDIKADIKISDTDVKTAYDERREQFKIGERRTIEQAVFQDEAKAKAAAEAVRKNQKLRVVAAKDTYSKPAEVEQATLPADIAVPVFAATKGAILNPIKTPLGWHVIVVSDITPARIQTYADVAADLRKELESDAVHAEMESRMAKIDDALGQGDGLDQIASALSLPVVTLAPVDLQGNTTGTPDALLAALTQNKDLLSSLFELMEGETSDLSEINESTYAVFSLQTITPSRDRDFGEVKAQIETQWLAEQRQNALEAAVSTLTDAISKKTKTFEQGASDAGAVIKTARDVSRESQVAGLNDPIALTRLFDETDFSALVKIPTDKGVIIAKVLDARIPEGDTAAHSTTAEMQWRTQMEQAVTALFINDLRRNNKVRVNSEILEKTYGTKADEQP